MWLALLAGGPAADAADAPPALADPEWTVLFPGAEFSRVRAERYCRQGDPEIAFVRLDPRRCRIAPYHEREYADLPAVGMDGWQSRLQAPVLINAGLYGQDRRPLGVLRRHGNDLGGRPHGRWKGLLVAGGTAAQPADILDLSRDPERAAAGSFPEAVQSMMLLDRSGRIRVRRSEKVAPRSGVAIDGTGHLLLFVTEGGYTLWETALLLRESGWGIVAAMALDGGREANLAVATDSLVYRTADHAQDGWMRSGVSLPAVIAVWPDR